MIKSLFVLIMLSFFYASSSAQMGSKPTFPEGEASRQEKLLDTVVVLCTSFDEDTKKEYTDTLCSLYENLKLQDTSPSLFTKENVKDIFVFLTQVDSNKLLITDTDYSLLKFLRLKTTLNDMSYTIFDSTEYFVNDEEYRVIKWEDGIPLKLYENDEVYNTKFYEWKEFWECGEKLDYAPVWPFAIPIPTTLIKEFELDDKSVNSSEVLNPSFVFSVIPLSRENNNWLDELKGRTVTVKRELSDIQSNVIVEIYGKGIDLNGDNITDAFWFIDLKKEIVFEWYARLYMNIDGMWTPVWFQYFNEMY